MMTKHRPATGKVALVTGAGTGIGRCTAAALAKEGFAVVLAGRTEERLLLAAQQIEAEVQTAALLTVPADVSDPGSVTLLFEKTREAWGRLDVLFNNAGLLSKGVPLEELSWEQWCSVINTNLTGAFLCAQQAFKMMKEQNPRGGRIINNGSISAHVPRPNSAAYTVSKHGITGLTRSISLDGRPFDIACGQIDIGNAATPATGAMKTGMLQASGAIAPEPTIDAADVARAVVYMATLPLDTNVQFMTVMATKMPYIGRG